jgi:hypothetical protein
MFVWGGMTDNHFLVLEAKSMAVQVMRLQVDNTQLSIREMV